MLQYDLRFHPTGSASSLIGFSILLSAIIGCGGSDLPELGQVTGVITLDGQPLPEAMVRYQPATGRQSSAMTDAQGRYELLFLKGANGALLGKHTVSITITSAGDADQPSAQPEVTLPANYNTESTLTAEVEAGANVIDFELSATP